MKKEKIENRIKKILYELNIKRHLIGYEFWIQAIEYMLKSNTADFSMTKEIYVGLAEKNNVTPSKIEKGMRDLIKDSENIIKDYFNVTYKITNSSFLALITDKIRLEMGGEKC